MSSVYLSAMGNLFYEISQVNTNPIPTPPINNVPVFEPTAPPLNPIVLESVTAYERQWFQNAFEPVKNYKYTSGTRNLGKNRLFYAQYQIAKNSQT
jgi:hypothetical protein